MQWSNVPRFPKEQKNEIPGPGHYAIPDPEKAHAITIPTERIVEKRVPVLPETPVRKGKENRRGEKNQAPFVAATPQHTFVVENAKNPNGARAKELADARNEILGLQKEIEGLNISKSVLEKDIERRTKEQEKLHQKLVALETRTRDLESEKKTIHSEKVSIERELKETGVKVVALEKEIEKSKTKKESASGIVVKLETLQKTHSELKEKLQKTESELESNKKHSAILRSDLSSAKENIEKLEKEVAAAKLAYEESVSAAQKQSAELSEKILSLESEKSGLSAKLSDAETKIESATRLQRETDSTVENLKSELTAKIAELQQTVSNAESELSATRSTLHAEIEKEQLRTAAIEKQLADKISRYGDLLADFERLSTLHNETTAKLSHQIETLESEIISTSEKYKTEVERTEVLEAKLVEKESSISQMESERKAFGEEQQKIQQSMQTELRTWAADHAEVSAQLNEAREQWKKDTTFLTERAESLKRAMADAETEATARYEELETEMQHAKRQIAHLAEGLERHEAARLLAEEKLRTALSDISILKTQIQTAEQRIESIIAEKDEVSIQFSNLQSLFAAQTLQISQLTKEINDKNDQILRSNAQVEELAERAVEAEHDVDALKAERQQLTEQLSAMQTQQAQSAAEAEATLVQVEVRMKELENEISRRSEEFVNNEKELKQKIICLNEAVAVRDKRMRDEKVEFTRLTTNFGNQIETLQKEKKILNEKAESISAALEQLRKEHQLLQSQRAEDLRHAQRAFQLDREMESLKAQHEALKIESEKEKENYESYAEKLTAENHELQEQVQQTAKERDDFVNEYTNIKQHLMNAIASKGELSKMQELNRQLNLLQATTAREVEDLTQMNAELVGHTNHKQKIRLHLKVKEENNCLKLERVKLQDALRHKDEEIRKLEAEVLHLQDNQGRVRVMPTMTPVTPAPSSRISTSTTASRQTQQKHK